MKAYKDLTEIGKKRRLTQLTKMALEHYDLDVKSVSYYDEYTNIFYKVIDNNQKRYTLKIFREETTELKDNLAEIFFLNEVKRNSDIVVPTIIKSKDNQDIIVIDNELFDTPKRIAIYEWIEGNIFADCTTMQRFEAVGVAMARLHTATENTSIPSDLELRKWNQVFYFSGENTVYHEEKYQYMLDDDFVPVMDFVVPYLNKHLEKIYENKKVQLLHGDLNPWNILVHKEEIRFIDFEDNILGTPLHDIAITLFYYKHSENYNYCEVREHLLKGYNSIKQLDDFTEFQMDILIYARLVNFLNYVLVVEYDKGEYCKKRLQNVKEFINKYAKEEWDEYKRRTDYEKI